MNKSIIKKCLQCGKTIKVIKSRINRTKFCSKICYSQNETGKIPWNKGMIGYRAGIKKPWMKLEDDDSYSWKGDKVGYRGLHKWVEKHLGKPSFCSHCNKIGNGRDMHWANKSGQYKRELSDWIRLCPSCHGKHDKILRANKLKN